MRPEGCRLNIFQKRQPVVTKNSIFNDPVIPIGILAEKVGLSLSAVRKYETEGLIIPHRTASGRRLFSQEDIDRVLYIKHLIRNIGLNIEGIRRLQSLLPCWSLYDCSEESRNHCKAYLEATRSCWSIKNLDCKLRNDGCRECDIYRFGTLCIEDIKRILFNQNSGEYGSNDLGSLLNKKCTEGGNDA